MLARRGGHCWPQERILCGLQPVDILAYLDLEDPSLSLHHQGWDPAWFHEFLRSVDAESCSFPEADVETSPGCILVVQIHNRLDVTCSFYRQGVEVVISKGDLANSEVANPGLCGQT